MRKILFFLILFCPALMVYSQKTVTVTGTVSDAEGERIPGVTIVVQGKGTGTVTDIDGNYRLSNVSSSDILVFSFIGLQTQEIEVGNQPIIDVVLATHVEELEEVVVVGYGIQKKESAVAAISQVDGTELVKSGTVSLSNALTGKVPGVFTVQRSGEPGADAANIFIRGVSSWAGNAPLVIVDGVEGSFNDIDPNEIENLSVLKDASATAVYGVKGANGVILVTTKRGEKGKLRINYSPELGLKDPIMRRNMYDSYRTGLLMNEAYRNDGSWNLILSDDVLEHYRLQDMPYVYPNTDWEEVMVRDFGFTQKHNLNVRGGSEHTRVFASFTYLYDGDIIKTEKQPEYDPAYKFTRYNYRVNLDFDVTSTTVLSLNAGGFLGIKNQPNETAAIRTHRPIMMLGPMTIPPKYDAEALELYPDLVYPDETGVRLSNTGITNANNPYNAVNYSGFRQTKSTGLSTTIILDQKLDFITKGLSAKGKAAYNHDEAYLKTYNLDAVSYRLNRNGEWTRYVGRDEVDAERAQLPISPGSEDISSGPFRSWYYELSIDYARNFDGHNVSALLLGNRRTWQNDVAFPHFEEGIVGRVTYDYNTKYLLEINLGLNGSEQFSPKNRYGFFPSYALGWNMHHEKFMEPMKPLINRVKLRYSYGEVGSDNAGGDRWLYTTTYTTGDTNAWAFRPGTGTNPGPAITPIAEGQVANENAQWERSIKQDIGMELGFLKNNMFLVTLDFFKEKRDKILLSRQSIPDWFGVGAKQQNLGKTETWGYEAELKYTGGSYQGLSHWVKLGVNFSDNKIVERDEPYLKPEYSKVAGKRIDQIFGNVSTGYIDDVDERAAVPRYGGGMMGLGDVVYVDFNGDGNIDVLDEVPLGYSGTYPLFFYTLSGGFMYKGFDVEVNFQAATHVSRILVDAYMWPFHRLDNQFFDFQSDYWRPDNRDAAFPTLRMDANRVHNNILDGKPKTISVMDASYLRLKTMNIGYTIPSVNTKKHNIEQLRIFLQGNNLFTFSPGMPIGDPEGNDDNNGRVTWGYYPLIRRITLGMQLSF